MRNGEDEENGKKNGKKRRKGVVHVKEGYGSYLISSLLVLVMQCLRLRYQTIEDIFWLAVGAAKLHMTGHHYGTAGARGTEEAQTHV